MAPVSYLGTYHIILENLFLFSGVFAAAHDLKMEWVVIKGISDYADGTASLTEQWMPFASVMAASVVNNILREPVVFEQWPHYQSNDVRATQNQGGLFAKDLQSFSSSFDVAQLSLHICVIWPTRKTHLFTTYWAIPIKCFVSHHPTDPFFFEM